MAKAMLESHVRGPAVTALCQHLDARSIERLRATSSTMRREVAENARSLVLSRTLQQVRIVEGKLQAARDTAERARGQLDVKRSRLSALVAERRELYRILQPRNERADKEATKSAKTVNALLGKLEQVEPAAEQDQSMSLAERPKPASASTRQSARRQRSPPPPQSPIRRGRAPPSLRLVAAQSPFVGHGPCRPR